MLIILDRDGVINEDSPAYIKSPEEWHAIPGSLEAIASLNKAGYQIVVASNQSGVGRGYFDVSQLLAINRKMQLELAKVGGHLDAVYFCPHRNEDHCFCRKPLPGMLIQISRDFGVDLASQAFFIGDSLRDIHAGQAAKCPTFLVKTGNGAKVKEHGLKENHIFNNLFQCSEYLIDCSH